MQQLWRSISSTLFILPVMLAMVPNLQAADSKDAVPESASVVVRWKTPQSTLGRIGDFVDAVQPGFGNVVKGALFGMGQGVGNPGMRGVDAEKDIWAIGFAESQKQPSVVFVVTASDVDSLKKNLLPNFTAYASGNIVVYSDNQDSLQKVRDRLDGKGSAFWPQFDTASVKLFEATDLSLIVNVKKLAKDFAEELKGAGPQIDEFIDRISDAIPDNQQQQMAMAFDVYRKLGKSGIEVIRDTNSWSFGLSFSKDAIRYEDRLQVATGSATAKSLATQPASDLSMINRLPASKAIYFGAKFESAGLIEWAMSLTRNMLSEAPAETLKQFDSTVKEMTQLKFGEMAMFIDFASELPAYRAGGMTMISPGERMRELSKTLIKAMGEIKLPNMTQTQKLEANVAKIGSDSVDRVTIKQEISPDADPSGFGKQIQSFMFGEEGMLQHVIYRSDRSFYSLGSVDDLKQVVTALDSTSAVNSAVVTARKRFPGKSNFVLFMDLAQIALNSLKIVGDKGLIPMNTKGLDSLTLEPAFIGYTLTCEPTAMRSQLEIPVELVQNISRLVTALLQPQ